MDKDKKIRELEYLLNELKAQDETAVTVEEVTGHRKKKLFRTGAVLRYFWKTKFLWLALIALILLIAVPVVTYKFLTNGSTFTESKGSFLEQITELNELATAESYTKVIVERQDNKLFGQSIGMDLPGTKRQLLVVIPGSVKAGVDFSKVEASDVEIDEQDKTVHLTLPAAEFLGGAEIYFDQVEVYSYEGLFRDKANIEEAYELAEEAKQMIIEESTGQGVLQMAEANASRTLKEMFSFAGYFVEIEFEEPIGK